MSLYPIVRYLSGEVEPTYADLIKMPNAYTGEAVDGLYMPLKLESNHQTWRSEGQRRLDGTGWAASLANQTLAVPAASLGTHPWPNLTDPAYLAAGAFVGDVCLLPANDMVGGIVFRGISNDATINLTFREGFEMRCVPGSAFTSFLKVSPEHDLMAVSNYYKIARQLKDAYPVEYNDLGKLWDLIKGAARVISPLMSVIPGGAMIRGAGTVLGKVGDALFAPSGRSKKDVVSATDLEKARQSVSAAIGRQSAPKVRKPRAKAKRRSKQKGGYGSL